MGFLTKPPSLFRQINSDERWFKTGDIAQLTAAADGPKTFKILGRASVDIIKSGGYKLSALEIESAIMSFCSSWISECSVVGVTDESGVWGEKVAVVISLCHDQPSGSDNEQVLQRLRKEVLPVMAKYKMPSMIRLVDAIPRNVTGKINKKNLQKLFHE